MTLVNEEAFHIEVSVDEIDIDEVEVGQEVDITLDALPNVTVIGNDFRYRSYCSYLRRRGSDLFSDHQYRRRRCPLTTGNDR